MAAPKIAFPFSSPFPQLLDSCLAREIEVVDRVMASFECHSPSCPIIGSHNLDECAELIEQAKKEGQL